MADPSNDAMEKARLDEDQVERVPLAVDAIVESYNEYGGINHIEGPNLPSREDIRALLEDILSLIFPGYVAPAAGLDRSNLKYFVGQRCTSVLKLLRSEVEKSLRHECKISDRCERTFGECYEASQEIALGLLERIPEIRRILSEDAHAAFRGDPAAKTLTEVLVSYPCLTAISAYRVANFLHREGVPFIPRMMTEITHGTTGIDIHPGATIDEGFFIDHGTGVVIGETSVIGTNVKIYQGVTLGALSVRKDMDRPEVVVKRHPTIEDNVTIYAGSTILGGDTVIGNGSIIGGNVWLTHSVPPNTKVIIEAPLQTFKDMVSGEDLRVPLNKE